MGNKVIRRQLVKQPADAHDVLQDAVTVALSHSAAPSPDSDGFKPWFYKVVRNKSIDCLRRLKRYEEDLLNEDVALDQVQHCPQHILNSIQTQQSIKAALDKLSLQQREIIVLKDFHDLSYQDIANVLEVPKGSVMSRLHRTRCALKLKLMPMVEE